MTVQPRISASSLSSNCSSPISLSFLVESWVGKHSSQLQLNFLNFLHTLWLLTPKRRTSCSGFHDSILHPIILTSKSVLYNVTISVLSIWIFDGIRWNQRELIHSNHVVVLHVESRFAPCDSSLCLGVHEIISYRNIWTLEINPRIFLLALFNQSAITFLFFYFSGA